MIFLYLPFANRMGKYLNILIHPAFVALIISLVVVFFVDPEIRMYQAELVYRSISSKEEPVRSYYHDFDHDGEGESFNWGMNTISKMPYIIFYNKEGRVEREWNCEGTWLINSPVICGDYDLNGKDEVYGFTVINDSVFLNGVEPYGKWSFEIHRKFICKTSMFNNRYSLVVTDAIMIDLTGDGHGEIVIALDGGYARQPRGIFAYDIKNDTLYQTPIMGAAISKLTFADLTGNGKPEILCRITSPSNYSDYDREIPYSDTCAWVMAFNNRLEFLFEPVVMPGKYGGVNCYDLRVRGVPYILAYHHGNSTDGMISRFHLFDLNGSLVQSNDPDQDNLTIMKLSSDDDQDEILALKDNRIYRLNEDLQLQKFRKLKTKLGSSFPVFIDIEGDGTQEMIFTLADNSKMAILRNDFSHSVVIDQPHYDKASATVKYSPEEPAMICINGEHLYSKFEYKKNPVYNLKYTAYLLGYLFLFGFFHLLFVFQRRRIKRIYDTERRINELQMLTIRNQMNPHFTFNAINSISSVIYKEDKKTAYDFFTKFSDLIRFTLKNAEKITVPLLEEIEFVKNYLDLEKFRFKEKFDYVVETEDELDLEIQVPRMIIQTFVENAVKHGLSHKEKNGLLKISISQSDHKLKMVIEDNGIGRQAAAGLDTHGTGKGTVIIDQIFDLYHKLKGKKIYHEFHDLIDAENKPAGTSVEIEVEI